MAFYLRDEQGHFQEAYAVTFTLDIIESTHLPGIKSAQMAEPTALMRECRLAERKPANIYATSHYAFGVVHKHGMLWKQRGFLTSCDQSIQIVNKSQHY